MGPWSGRPQPPDLADLLRKGQDRIKRVMPGGFGGARGLILIIALIVAVWLGSGFYTVAPDEGHGAFLEKRKPDFGKWR